METCFTLARHNSSAKFPQGQLVFDVLCFTEGKMFNLHFCVRDMVLEILILWTCKTFIFSKTGSVWRKWPLKWAVLYFFWCQKNTPWNILEHSFSETLFCCMRKESTILFLYEKIQIIEIPWSDIFYAVECSNFFLVSTTSWWINAKHSSFRGKRNWG